MAGLTRVFGVLLHGRRQLFHAGCGFFQRCSLLLGTGGEIVIAHRNLAGPAVNRVGAVTHVTHGIHQLTLHVTQAFRQLPNLVGTFHLNTLHQIAAGDMTNAVNQTVHWGDKGQFDTKPDRNNRRQYGNQHADQHPHRLAVRTVVIFHRDVIQAIVLLHVTHILLLKAILIALRWLIKERVDLPVTQ